VADAPRQWKNRGVAPSPKERWRWLEAHPQWDEMELRLRHHWSPEKVSKWLLEAHPTARPVPSRTLRRYVETKGEGWFATALVVARKTEADLTRVMALDEHARLIDAQKQRIAEMLAMETWISPTGARIPMPEVRQNVELLSRMYEQHLKLQKALGLVGGPVEPLTGMLPGERDAERPALDETRAFGELVGQLKDLGPDDLAEFLRLALGPPGRPENEDVVIDLQERPAAPPDPRTFSMPSERNGGRAGHPAPTPDHETEP
jgi:hypothetical protein